MGDSPSDSTHFSTTSCPPSNANAAEKIDEPTKSQHTMADVLAVRNTDSLTVCCSLTWNTDTRHHSAAAPIEIQPTHNGGPDSSTSNLSSRNQTMNKPISSHSGTQTATTARRLSRGCLSSAYIAASTN